MINKTEKLSNIHPGEILLEEFLIPFGISQNRLGRDIGVSPRRINEICLHKRAVSVDTAIRLAKYFGTSEIFWLNLQNSYDLEEAKDKMLNLDNIMPFVRDNSNYAQSSNIEK